MTNLIPSRPATKADLLPPPEVAQLLGVTTGTLEVWRSTKRYSLKYFKIGRLVKYQRGDVEAFISSRLVGAAPLLVEGI
jgi:predicted DNA-binding transcriptional regulator AlpA